MSKKTASAIKIIALLLVILAVLMQLQWVIIPLFSAYKFWMVVIAFCLVLITAR